MANPHVGEVTFKAGDDEYTLSFSANALCELETAIDTDVDDLVAKFASGKGIRLATLRVMFWQGLLDHHEGLSLDDAKRILTKLKPADMGQLIGKAFALSMPRGNEEGAANPPLPDGPQNGTGPASSTNGATPGAPSPNSGG